MGGRTHIIHLSDIHFRKSDIGTAQDPNFHLRNEIVRDVRTICNKNAADVIVISGDVAFAGDPAEYDFARTWLSDLCAACGTDLKAVFTIPGNHDVSRQIVDRPVIQSLHNSIKSQTDISLDALLGAWLSEKEAGRLLYEGLDHYSAFAQQFFCDLIPPDRTRSFRDLPMNDGSILRLWGINTCFVSSSADKVGDIFVDPAALQIPRVLGVENFVVAHHPISWIRQGQRFEDHLNDVARIQAFGHVHTNRISMNRDWLRLAASAAHPDRTEPGWEPGYNAIELTIEQIGGNRVLRTKTNVRVWQTAPGRFRSKMDKDRDVFLHDIVLDPWKIETRAAVKKTDEQMITSLDAPTDHHPDAKAMNTLREIGIRFYKLSFSKKSEIAGRLDLLEEEDMQRPDFERFRRVFLRAHDKGKLEDLMSAVKEAEGQQARGKK